MTKQEFDKAVKEAQDIQKQVPWNDPRKKEAHDKIQALVLAFLDTDIGPFES